MLMLKRKLDEVISIGDDVEVLVTEIRGDSVRVGVTAPKCVPVHRQEVDQVYSRQHAGEVPYELGLVTARVERMGILADLSLRHLEAGQLVIPGLREFHRELIPQFDKWVQSLRAELRPAAVAGGAS